MFFDNVYQEDCSNPETDPAELFNICLKILDKTMNECEYWPIKLTEFVNALSSRLDDVEDEW